MSWADKSSYQVWEVLSDNVYRRSLCLKFTKYETARRFSALIDLKAKASSRPEVPKPVVPNNVEQLLLLNASGHLKQVASTYSMLSMIPGASGIDFVTVTDTLRINDMTADDTEHPEDGTRE